MTGETRRVGESRYTTTQQRAAEKVLLDAAGTDVPVQLNTGLRPGFLERLPPHVAGLAPDRAAARAVVAPGKVLDALVGPAGSGKTTTLTALTDYWQRTVGPVTGLAPSATAAHTPGRSLGVECETTGKWLHETTGEGASRRAIASDGALGRSS